MSLFLDSIHNDNVYLYGSELQLITQSKDDNGNVENHIQYTDYPCDAIIYPQYIDLYCKNSSGVFEKKEFYADHIKLWCNKNTLYFSCMISHDEENITTLEFKDLSNYNGEICFSVIPFVLKTIDLSNHHAKYDDSGLDEGEDIDNPFG